MTRPTRQDATGGHHLLVEIHGCDPAELGDAEQFTTRLLAGHPDVTVLPAGRFHAFQPQGLSGALVIGDVVLTVHTWPEAGFAAFDLFSRSPLDADAWGERLAMALRHHGRSLGKT